MTKKRHKFLDHPIPGYFLLILFGMVMTNLFSSVIDGQILARLIPGFSVTLQASGMTVENAAGPGTAIGALAAAAIFRWWFRPSFQGMLKKENLTAGLLMLAPFLVFHYVGSIVSILSVGSASVLLAFLRAFSPGFGEEVIFRGLGISNYMRMIRSEKGIMPIFWLSSLTFGLIHILNVTAGAPFVVSLIQAVYATGIGMAFGAVFLRTGSLWPTILGHMSVDFLEFIRADLSSTGGVMGAMGVGDWITIAAGLFAAVLGLYLMRPVVRPAVMELWKQKWNRTDTAETAEQVEPE